MLKGHTLNTVIHHKLGNTVRAGPWSLVGITLHTRKAMDLKSEVTVWP